MKSELDYLDSLVSPAEVEHCESKILPHYHVYRMGGDTKFTVRKYYYDPEDPSDLDYKHVHAYEVANSGKTSPCMQCALLDECEEL